MIKVECAREIKVFQFELTLREATLEEQSLVPGNYITKVNKEKKPF